MIDWQQNFSASDWRLIRAFVAVMQWGSLTAAAKKLGGTQPTIGRQIRELETRAGEVYFHRRGHRLEPTEKAITLYPRALEVERAVTALARELAAPNSEGRTQIRLTMSTLFAQEMLPLIWPDMVANHPQVDWEITATDEVLDIQRRDADIAIRLAQPQQPDLIGQKVGTVNVGLYAHRAYLARNPHPQQLVELNQHRLLAGLGGEDVKKFAAHLGLSAQPLRLDFRCDDLRLRLTAIRAGIGIGSCHDWVAKNDSNLIPIFPEMVFAQFQVWLVTQIDIKRRPLLAKAYRQLQTLVAAHLCSSAIKTSPRS